MALHYVSTPPPLSIHTSREEAREGVGGGRGQEDKNSDKISIEIGIGIGKRFPSVRYSGIYNLFRRCIESEAHSWFTLRKSAKDIPYFNATPARESVCETYNESAVEWRSSQIIIIIENQ